jgi:hypothetical protein
LESVLKGDWEQRQTSEGRNYYVNHNERITTWTPPKKDKHDDRIALEIIDQHSGLGDIANWGEAQADLSQRLISAMLQMGDLIEDPKYTKSKPSTA